MGGRQRCRPFHLHRVSSAVHLKHTLGLVTLGLRADESGADFILARVCRFTVEGQVVSSRNLQKFCRKSHRHRRWGALVCGWENNSGVHPRRLTRSTGG